MPCQHRRVQVLADDSCLLSSQAHGGRCVCELVICQTTSQKGITQGMSDCNWKYNKRKKEQREPRKPEYSSWIETDWLHQPLYTSALINFKEADVSSIREIMINLQTRKEQKAIKKFNWNYHLSKLLLTNVPPLLTACVAQYRF